MVRALQTKILYIEGYDGIKQRDLWTTPHERSKILAETKA